MKDCVFCGIADGHIPAEKIYQDSMIIAFLDINPVQFGHSLIVPRTHFPSMNESPDDIIEYIFVKAKHLMPIIQKATKADYVAVSVVGLDVPHFHVHLVPRYFNDGLANFWPTKKYNGKEMRQFADKIRSLI